MEFFLEKGIHRNAHLVVIGGGAVSDFAGFVASTILRGIAFCSRNTDKEIFQIRSASSRVENTQTSQPQ